MNGKKYILLIIFSILLLSCSKEKTEKSSASPVGAIEEISATDIDEQNPSPVEMVGKAAAENFENATKSIVETIDTNLEEAKSEEIDLEEKK